MQKKKQKITTTRTTTMTTARRITRLSTVLLLSSVLVLSSIAAVQLVLAGVINKAYAQDNGFQVTTPTPGLTREWWQWVLSFPADENPLTDRTGEQCDKGDLGDTFFLVGTLGGRVVRDCTVTEGQDILIPIVNCINAREEGGDETAESLLAFCAETTDQTRNAKLIIDRQVQILRDNRVTNPTFFEIELPEDNLFGAPAGSYEAVADGYWALIEGLSAGEHTITVDGKQHGQTSFGKWDFRVQATYHLTVVGEEATDEAATDEEEALATDEEVQEEQQPEEEEAVTVEGATDEAATDEEEEAATGEEEEEAAPATDEGDTTADTSEQPIQDSGEGATEDTGEDIPDTN